MAERKAFLLRIDPGLWAELEAWAETDLRSVNGQIEFLLREAVNRRRGRGRTTPARPPEPPEPAAADTRTEPGAREGRG